MFINFCLELSLLLLDFLAKTIYSTLVMMFLLFTFMLKSLTENGIIILHWYCILLLLFC